MVKNFIYATKPGRVVLPIICTEKSMSYDNRTNRGPDTEFYLNKTGRLARIAEAAVCSRWEDLLPDRFL